MTEPDANLNANGHSDPQISTADVISPSVINDEERAISLSEENWQDLLQNLQDGRCTPFLGAGASRPPLPLASEIARSWATAFHYPLEDSTDLTRVSQFLAVTRSARFPKSRIRDHFNSVPPPDFQSEGQIHALLADLRIPVYVTTNYDDYMERALRLRGKDPKLELCQWNKSLRDWQSAFTANPEWRPNENSPVVFHLHGYKDFPESLVLTEDDYVDFLIEMDQEILPRRIHEAFAGDSLLFLGYGLGDWNFRVLFRTLSTYMVKALRPAHVSVQLAPLSTTMAPEKKTAVLEYLNRYFGDFNIRVYWGTCRQFAGELRSQWLRANNAAFAAANSPQF